MSIVIFSLHSQIAVYLLLDYGFIPEQHPAFCCVDSVASTVFDVILLSLRKPGECVYIY